MKADDILLLASPFFLVTMAIEAAILAREGRPYGGKDTAASLSMGIGYLVIEAGWRIAEVGVLAFAWQYRLFDLENGIAAWALAIVGWDFAYYWYHRAGHEVRLLWASHVNHHSSERYNLSTALRQTWTPFAGILFFVPLALIGLTPEKIVVAGALNLLYQYWIHTETIGNLGAVEWVLNTPSHHRVHHGTNPQYIDRNYAGILIVWDRLFGSFEPEGDEVVYGLTKNIRSFHPLWIAFHEYAAIVRDVRSADRWRDRLGFVFRFPGWQPAAVSRPLPAAAETC
ncbi:MAG: sterol desaturase family protein [Candidatus Binatia bacterium]